MVLVETMGVPLVGVKVVVRVMTIARVIRVRLAAEVRLQVRLVLPALVMVLVKVQTVSVAARGVRRLVGVVPTCRTTPGPGAVNVVMMLVLVRVLVAWSGRVWVLVPVDDVISAMTLSLAGATGVTAADALEGLEVPPALVAVAVKV